MHAKSQTVSNKLRNLLKLAKEQPDFAEGTASLTEKRPAVFPPYPGLNL